MSTLFNSTRSSSPTSTSGATGLPPIGDSFIFNETSSNISGSDNVLCSFERTDVRQNSNKTLYYNRFSILPNISLQFMERFRIQLLLADKTWSTR